MRAALITLLTVFVLAIGGTLTFIYSGIYDVAATSPHWPITYWAMETVRMRSIKMRASSITPPDDLVTDTTVVRGTEHFAAHCASCHGAPGVPRGETGERLYPQPADLTHAADRYTPGELFWILKNGIKMSGMPSWADHSDDELWSSVAFIEKLPTMSDADYGKLIMESMKQGGRHSHDMPGMGAMPGMNHGAMPGMGSGAMPAMDHGADKAPASDGHPH